MSKWLQSGRRRDICYLLVDAGELPDQQLKSALETHYDDRIDPAAFYETLGALVDTGHLERDTEGVHDIYALSAEGERRLREHHMWATTCLEDPGQGDY